MMFSLLTAAFASEVILQLSDPDKLMARTPAISITGAGQVFPRDDGQAPDANLNDSVFTVTLNDPASSLQMTINDGSKTWQTTVTPEGAYILLRLQASSVDVSFDQVAAVSQPAPNAGSPGAGTPGAGAPGSPGGGSPGGGSPGGGSPGGASVIPPGGGGVPDSGATLTQVSIASLIGLLLMLGVPLLLKSATRPRETITGEDRFTPIPPRRVSRAQRDVLLALSATHRVIIVGDPDEASPFCLSNKPALAQEIIAAVEWFAATPGLPVALWVSDAGRLGQARDPIQHLAALVGGRFPLYVVDGPATWAEGAVSPP